MTHYFKDNAPDNKEAKKLIEQHKKLVHTDNIKVISHVQRESDDWVINTLMLENIMLLLNINEKNYIKV